MSYARASGVGTRSPPAEHRQRTRKSARAQNRHGRRRPDGEIHVAEVGTVARSGRHTQAVARGTVGYGTVSGMWRSLVSAPALGAGGRRFESGHPDQFRAHVDLYLGSPGSQIGSHVLPFRVWRTARDAAGARTRSTSITPPSAAILSITGAAWGGGGARSPLDSGPVASGSAARSVAGPRLRSRTSSSSCTTNCGKGSARRPGTQCRTLSMTF